MYACMLSAPCSPNPMCHLLNQGTTCSSNKCILGSTVSHRQYRGTESHQRSSDEAEKVDFTKTADSAYSSPRPLIMTKISENVLAMPRSLRIPRLFDACANCVPGPRTKRAVRLPVREKRGTGRVYDLINMLTQSYICKLVYESGAAKMEKTQVFSGTLGLVTFRN